MKIYHAPGARSIRALWMAEEMGLDYEVVRVAFPPVEADFLAANPTGTLPLLIDGAVVITESIAILQYMAERYGPTPLAPGGGDPGFADYLQFLHVGEATLATPLTALARTRFMAPDDQKANWTAENCRAVFLDRLQLVTNQLKRAPHMAGEAFTAADISVGYAIGFGKRLGLGDNYDPSLIDYWRRLQERPAYQRTRAI